MDWSIRPASEFDAVAREWATLNARNSGVAVLDPLFVELALRYFPRGDEVLAVGQESGTTRAMAVLHPVKTGAWVTMQPSQCPLGLFVAESGLALEDALGSLSRALPGFNVAVSLSQLDPDVTPRAEPSARIELLDYIDTASIDLSGSFEDYWARCGKSVRRNVRWRRNRLEKAGISTRLEVVEDPSEIRAAVAEYSRLEREGWKGGAGTAVDLSDEQGAFYVDLLERSCQLSQARVYQFYFDDRVAASDLCVQRGDSIIILKIAYDESMAKHGPSVLMRAEQMEQLFAEGRFRTLEFYGKLRDWHLQWAPRVRRMYHLNYFRFPILRRLREWKKRLHGVGDRSPKSTAGSAKEESKAAGETA